MEPLNDVDNLILGRWSEAAAFYAAFDDLVGRLNRRLRAVTEALEPWVIEAGYQVRGQYAYAEFQLFRPSWLDEDEEPAVCLAFGGVYPAGFRKVDCGAPYLCLYALGLSKSEQAQFGQRFQSAWGQSLESWKDSECDDAQPLGRWLKEDAAARLKWATDPELLTAAARAYLAEVMVFGDAIDKALQEVRESR